MKKEFQEKSKSLYLGRLYQQAKQLSQIIAYIWQNVEKKDEIDGKIANKLKIYFEKPSEEEKGKIEHAGNLKKLLAANPREDNYNVEADLLRHVFTDYKDNENLIFPMFSNFELGREKDHTNLGYCFEVNINDFFGVLEDVNVNDPSFFKFVIPYPPRPQLGQATVTSEELETWVKNREKDKYFADNCYIPTTCS